MKAMLASINCQKGKVEENLSNHEQVVSEAADAGCDIVVFPEMSLTGYITPGKHGHPALALESEPVRRIAGLGRQLDICIVFGIAETNPEGPPFISQVVAMDGAISAIYRKRHIAENEIGLFTPGAESTVANIGDSRFGIAVCADRDVPDEFEFAARCGASIVFHPSAPGLDPPRRTTQDTWRQGYDWWRDTCINIHSERATRLGISIAVVTQAGITEDEDFPGWAGLIGPDGELWSELPDWQAAKLIIEV